jgi:lipid-A-disaccharide synthase-like uncharacterized protein
LQVSHGLSEETVSLLLNNWMLLMTNSSIWIAFGMMGQLLFTARFVVQWLSSEREKKSVVPTTFWYFSIGGGVILLVYAIYKQDIVFIMGQASGLFVYVRNLQLLRNEHLRLRAAQSEVSAVAAAPPHPPRSEFKCVPN